MRYSLRNGMPGGGYIFSTSNCIYTGMPLACYELHARGLAAGGSLRMKEKLSGRERVNLAIAHQEGDRVPRSESFWTETIPLWHQQGLDPCADVADLFDYDIAGGGWVSHEAQPGFLVTLEETATGGRGVTATGRSCATGSTAAARPST